MTAKILDVTPDEYHALPHLSSTIAKTLITRSPRHAKEMRGKDPTPAMDFGSVGHRLTLGKGKAFKALPYDDWRTKDAKADREAAREAGLIPIKQVDYERAMKVSDAVVRELADRRLALNGQSEVVIVWDEPTEFGPVTCRCMMDHLWISAGRILDLKITENAAPDAIERSAENLGYAVQAAAYTRALAALLPALAGRIQFLFAFVESEPPYAMNLTEPDGLFRELGERRWLRAVRAWARCLAANEWPSYGGSINRLSVPGWALSREEQAA